LLKLSEYDFNTEVDVNILGHIFEHSLSEIEEITTELSAGPGEHVPLAVSKRKKDGVYYTPKYITQYIVENTIGTLCNEKRKELEIEEIEFDGSYKKKDGKLLAKGKKLYQKLDGYKSWLLSLKIVDPACGSGAFLNQALNFLIREHKNIDDIIAELTNTALRLFDTEKSILENNLYGVDINEESVEIAKLSLWLRTAQKGRKLSVLSNNIKCGNSLIDDPAVAGDKAFNWNVEFPQIFNKKKKQAWHITTATYNTRYSQRMFDNYVKPGEPVLLSEKEEQIITDKIAEIVREDKLNILAFNVCVDHMHIVLVCEKEEVPKIMQKIKSMSARTCNIAMGRTIPAQHGGACSTVATAVTTAQAQEHAPVPTTATVSETPEHAPVSEAPVSEAPVSEHAPVSGQRGKTQSHLWARKSGDTEIQSEEQLYNTIKYIRTNRQKHKLPENKKLEKTINEMCCSVNRAFRAEYNGGFDVVIGNPPYVRQELFGEFKPYFETKFEVFEGTTDLFAYFYEKSFQILVDEGRFGFISNTFDKTKAATKLRNYLRNNTTFINYVDFTEVQIFEGATTYPVIIVARNSKETDSIFKYTKIQKANQSRIIDIDSESCVEVAQNSLESRSWSFNSVQGSIILKKICQHQSIKDQYGKCFRGIVTGFNEAFIIDRLTKEILEKEHYSSKDLIKPFYEGKDLSKWHTAKVDKYLIFTRRGTDIDKYPALKQHLELNREKLTPKNSPEKKIGRKPGPYKWFEIQDSVDYYKVFENEKITWPNLQSENKFCLENYKYYINAPSVVFPSNSKTLLIILNSKLIWFFLKSICVIRSGGYIEVKPQYFEQIPIPEFKDEETFENLADKIIKATTELQAIQLNLINLLRNKFEIERITKKLQNWHKIEFKEFLKELKKAKVKLSLSDEAEWMQYFNEQKQKAQSLKAEINKTDKEIDQMVYELYGLTEEEIKIVES